MRRASGVPCQRCVHMFVTNGILRWKKHFGKVFFAEANMKTFVAEEILSVDQTHRQIMGGSFL